MLIITVQVMLVFAYRNLGKTTVTYGTATDVVTGLARVQRETLELAIELERLRLPRRARRARRVSWPVGPAGSWWYGDSVTLRNLSTILRRQAELFTESPAVSNRAG